MLIYDLMMFDLKLKPKLTDLLLLQYYNIDMLCYRHSRNHDAIKNLCWSFKKYLPNFHRRKTPIYVKEFCAPFYLAW